MNRPYPPSRRVATPFQSPQSLKRKERDHQVHHHFKPPPRVTKSLKPPPPRLGSASTHATKPTFPPQQPKPAYPSLGSALLSQAAKPEGCNNTLLAGYMAYEFLTKGTILGEQFDPARAAASPVASRNLSQIDDEPSRKGADERYAEVASLLKTDGAHIPGVVNPTQLASYLNR